MQHVSDDVSQDWWSHFPHVNSATLSQQASYCWLFNASEHVCRSGLLAHLAFHLPDWHQNLVCKASYTAYKIAMRCLALQLDCCRAVHYKTLQMLCQNMANLSMTSCLKQAHRSFCKLS